VIKALIALVVVVLVAVVVGVTLIVLDARDLGGGTSPQRPAAGETAP
jgi:putative exporter of polyketide antibiotics